MTTVDIEQMTLTLLQSIVLPLSFAIIRLLQGQSWRSVYFELANLTLKTLHILIFITDFLSQQVDILILITNLIIVHDLSTEKLLLC